MTEYNVPLVATVVSWVKVEANSVEEAVEEAYMQGAPGLMHLDNTYPDVNDYEVDEDWIDEMTARENIEGGNE